MPETATAPRTRSHGLRGTAHAWGRVIAERHPRQWTAPRALAVASVILVLAVHGFAAWGATVPAFQADEVGNIGYSRLFAGVSPEWSLAGNGYAPALGALISPAWWFGASPPVVYSFGLVLGVLAAVASVWPLSVIARWVGASPTTAVVVASVVSLAPARSLTSNYVIAENLFMLATALVVVAAIRLEASRSVSAFVVFSVGAGLTVLVHGRGVALAGAAFVWCAALAFKRFKGAARGAALAVVTATLSLWVSEWATQEVYWGSDRTGSTVARLLEVNVGETLARGFGMGWYVTAAWPVVAVVGLGFVSHRLRLISAKVFVLVAFGASVALALGALTPEVVEVVRLDVMIYGRYIDHVVAILAVCGLAALTRTRVRWLPALVGAATAAVSVAFLAVTVPRIQPGAPWEDVHAAGVSHLLDRAVVGTDAKDPWLVIVGAMILINVLVALLDRQAGALVTVLGIYWMALSIADDVGRVDPFDDRSVYVEVAAMGEELPNGTSVAIDYNYSALINTYAYGLQPHAVEVVDLDEGAVSQDVVITVVTADAPRQAGAAALRSSLTGGLVLWVYPGDVFDELDAAGLLRHPPSE